MPEVRDKSAAWRFYRESEQALEDSQAVFNGVKRWL